MFIAMNRFQVLRGREGEFEQVWLGRKSQLEAVPGFVVFHLLRGPATEDHTLFASHTIWASRQAFEDWTRSEAFREAHRDAGDHRGLYAGAPNFEGFDVLQEVRQASS